MSTTVRITSGDHNDGAPRFCVAMPALNGAAWIDIALASILLQSGPFRIRCHVQDGGSHDATLERVEAWSRRIASRSLPLLCRGVEFSYASGPDGGMYDAIAIAFDHMGVSEGDYMTWLNVDDGFLPGAFAAVAQIFALHSATHWLGGRVALANEVGAITNVYPLRTYARGDLGAGLHDGRRLGFVMQEGTFWRASVWRCSGGLDRRLRLAGDFDLWRRFAKNFDYYVADTVLGFHRRRRDQLSANMEAYYGEVEAIVDGPARAAAWAEREVQAESGGLGQDGSVLIYRDGWEIGAREDAPPDERIGMDWRPVSGFDEWEGPFPNLGIASPVRWALWPSARFEYRAARAVSGTLVIHFRNAAPQQELAILCRGAVLHSSPVAHCDLRKRQVVWMPIELEPGHTAFELRMLRNTQEGQRNLGLLIERITLEATKEAPRKQVGT